MAPASIQGHRLTLFLGKAELSQPEQIQDLAELPPLDFQHLLPSSCEAARALLIQQRKSEHGYKPPENKRRNRIQEKLGSKSVEQKYNEDNWAFNKHEVAKAFGTLLSQVPLESPGIAQALLSHVSLASIQELWCHLHDARLEKRMNRRFFRRSSSSIIPELAWLDTATQAENLEYIRLLCQIGISQEALDHAFGIALSKRSIGAMEVLLAFGAVASVYQDTIRDRVKLGDVALTRLLLSAPRAMSVEAWQFCMEPEVGAVEPGGRQSPETLLMCLAHRAEVVCGSLLLKSLDSQNLQAMASVLAYASSDDDFVDVHRPACQLASRIKDHERRHKFFDMLERSGFLTDSATLRDELMKDVKTRHLPLIQLFADAGVSLDIEPNNAMFWAVSRMDLEMLELFENGTFSSPVSLALNYVPESTPELDMLRLLEIFGSRGLCGDPLDLHLVRAARKQQSRLVRSLLCCGASVEFEQAAAIRSAIKMADFSILSSLLQTECSNEVLSRGIPTAMALRPRSNRFRAMKALLAKGDLNEKLGVPLQMLSSEDGEIDSELIRLLLQHHAPLDGVGDNTKNAVLVVARRGNLSVLRMLCDASPCKETISDAVPIAFSLVQTHGYGVALEAIQLLLETGAVGIPVHKTLLVAAKEDSRLDIARLLIQKGAEANYLTGACFAVAIETANFKLLEILCEGCPPSRASTESVLLTAIDPRHHKLQTLELLLGSTTSIAAALNASWAPEKFMGNMNMIEIIPCFLRHGLDANLGNGCVPCFAIQEQNVDLLASILSADLSIASLTTAFRDAANVQNRAVELEMMKLLLEKAESAEIGQSEFLLQETSTAIENDFLGLHLLLRHNAVADFNGGTAVQAAAASGSLQVLNLLLLSGPSSSTIKTACLVAAASGIRSDQKQSTLELLLDANGGLRAGDISGLLADAVKAFPSCTQLPQLLLARGVKIDFKILETALATASCDLFMALAGSIASPITMLNMFRCARKTAMDPTRRYWIYQYLLGRGVPSDDVSEALLDFLGNGPLDDLSIAKLLLEHGAAVSYKRGASFALALAAKALEAVRLLSQYLIGDDTAGLAFEHARMTSELDSGIRFEVYHCLLQWRITKTSIYYALLNNLESCQPDQCIVQLLLESGADPNEDGAECFVVAARAGAETEFRALSKYAKLALDIKVLLNSFKEEYMVAWWVGVCLEEQPHWIKIDQDELLFQCMRRFPRGTMLLNRLLDNGVSASAKTNCCLCPGWQPELCTALIWALIAKPRIDNDTILALVARGDAAAPTYSTPQKKVSAPFVCLLDQTRTPVLTALLSLDRARVLQQTMAEFYFRYIAAYPELIKDELPNEINPLTASLFVGNFDAFRLLYCKSESTSEDGLLHLAAWFALPKFVAWLLDTHEANLKLDEYGNLIPLALVCSAKPAPWCRFAKREADLLTRQKQVMDLLRPRTDLAWTYDKKMVLHHALDNGPRVAKIMIEALDIRHDPRKNDRYLYSEDDGMQYSPEYYVRKFLSVDEAEKETSILHLQAAGMKPRYFRDVEPNKGISQPDGYVGLPPRFSVLWEDPREIHETRRRAIKASYRDSAAVGSTRLTWRG